MAVLIIVVGMPNTNKPLLISSANMEKMRQMLDDTEKWVDTHQFEVRTFMSEDNEAALITLME